MRFPASLPGDLPRLRAVLLAVGAGCLVWSADWLSKALWVRWPEAYHQHHAQRPLWVLLPLVVCLGGLLLRHPRPAMALGAGAALAGAAANLVEVRLTGFAWNMIPVPGSDHYCNLADLAAVCGGTAAWMSLLRSWQLEDLSSARRPTPAR